MARGRAKKSAQKGQSKATGSSSSPVKKTKSVDEVTGIRELQVPSPIAEKAIAVENEVEEVYEMVPATIVREDKISQEQRVILDWKAATTSGANQPETARRMPWADDVEQQERNQVRTSPLVMIDSDDIQEEVEYWSSAVVCYVLGANPPFKVMDGFFRRIWGNLGIEKTAMVGKGLFIVRFKSVESCLKVTMDGYQFFDQKPVITRMWEADMVMDKESIQSVPIWIKLPGLALKYWGEKSLFKIAGLVGPVAQMDKATKSKDRLQFARVLVEVKLQQILPDVIFFCNEHGCVVEQKVEYEWRPTNCKKCEGIGHGEDECRKGGVTKKWVPKKTVRVDEDGFQLVGNGVAKVVQPPEVVVHNSFNALLDDVEESIANEMKDSEVEEEGVNRVIASEEEGVDKGQGLKAPMPHG